MKKSKSEATRRKDNCVSCTRFMPIKAKDMCQNCWHKVKRKTQPEFYLRTRYTEIKQRCTNINNTRSDTYYGMEVLSKEEFLTRFRNDKTFLKLFEKWLESNHDFKLSPSVDRIDVTQGYTLSNIQFITHSENCTKDQDTVPVVATAKNGHQVGQFVSMNEAARKLKVPQANI